MSLVGIYPGRASKFQVKIKEAMNIEWENHALNRQLKHLELSLSTLSVAIGRLNFTKNDSSDLL